MKESELMNLVRELEIIFNEAPRPQGGASRKGNLTCIVPLDPAYKAGLAGHLPAKRLFGLMGFCIFAEEHFEMKEDIPFRSTL